MAEIEAKIRGVAIIRMRCELGQLALRRIAEIIRFG
jgi:hypothetical protein